MVSRSQRPLCATVLQLSVAGAPSLPCINPLQLFRVASLQGLRTNGTSMGIFQTN